MSGKKKKSEEKLEEQQLQSTPDMAETDATLMPPYQDNAGNTEELTATEEAGDESEIELLKQAVENQKRIAAENLDKALRSIFTGYRSHSSADAEDKGIGKLIEYAIEKYNRAQDAIKKGEWAEYGSYQEELGKVLKELKTASGK